MENAILRFADYQQKLKYLVSSFRFWGVLGLTLLLILHWPTNDLILSTDDYLLSTSLKGNQALADIGFHHADPARPWHERIAEAFHFFGQAQGTTTTYREYGNLVWWSSLQGLMSPLRPLAAITHWLDFQVLDADPFLVRLHNLVYLLLMWGAALLLFRRLTDWKTAVLASALVLSDFSLSMNLDWLAARNSYMAVGFGMLTLLTFKAWRSGAGSARFLYSILLYTAALLTAEASVAVLGYMGAYALTMDRRGWFRGSLAVLPYLLITLVWRVAYSEAGFGAQHIGLYADPGRGLGHFLEQLMVVYPCIVTSMITGVDGIISPFSPDMQSWVRGLAWAVTVLSLYFIKGLLREQPQVRFMLLGSALAVIPHASLLSAGSRSGTFVAIGFFFVFATWIRDLWRRRSQVKPLKFIVILVLTWHLGVPFLLSFWQNYGASKVAEDSEAFYSSIAQPMREARRSLVMVNPPRAAKVYYIPFEWAEKGRVLPLSLNALAPGLGEVVLTRTSQRTFQVKTQGQMAVNHEVDIRTPQPEGSPFVHKAYVFQMLQGLVTSPAQHYYASMRLSSGTMNVKILEVFEGVPTNVQVEFIGDESPEHMVWQYYDWQEEKYKVMKIPRVGDTVTLAGPFVSKGGM